jgi:nitrate reductase alpha subunit
MDSIAFFSPVPLAFSSNGSPYLDIQIAGSTWNILNAEIEAGKSIEQAVSEPSNILTCPSFAIGDEDFGTIAFHRIPIKLPIRIEAILGMEFFENHTVFLDFVEKFAYFKRPLSNHQGQKQQKDDPQLE